MTEKTIHAVIQIGSKQFLIKEGDHITAEKLELKDGEVFSTSEVLLIHDGSETKVGTPFIEGASVELIHDGTNRGEKIRVAKFRAKSRYRRVQGHRQTETHLTVKSIKI